MGKASDTVLRAVNYGFTAARNLAIAASTSSSTSSGGTDPIPKKWDEQALKAWEYYLTVAPVKNGISSWLSFVLGDGIDFITENEDDRKKIMEFSKKLKLDRMARDYFKHYLVRGEALAYRVFEGSEVERLRSINPVSIIPKYEDGILTEIDQYQLKNGKPTGKPVPLEGLDNYYHFRLDAPEWGERGTSLVLSAFTHVDILQAYLTADKSIAKRWTTVLRLIKIGGVIGNKIFEPKKKDIAAAKTAFDNMNPDEGLVVPSYWDVKTYGTEGEVLDTTTRIEKTQDAIAMALLMIPFLVTGSGPAVATAKISLKKLKYQIKEFRSVIIDFLDWLYNEEILRSIDVDPEIKLAYQFGGLDIDTEEWEQRLLKELFDLGIVSRRTLQLRWSLDPTVEDSQISNEKIILSRSWSAQDLIGAVGVGILPTEAAREMLGLTEDEMQLAVANADKKEMVKMYATADAKMKAKGKKKPPGA